MSYRPKYEELAFYYRCVLELNHGSRHHGGRIDEYGADLPEVTKSSGPAGEVSWSEAEALNQAPPPIREHPKVKDQLSLYENMETP